MSSRHGNKTTRPAVTRSAVTRYGMTSQNGDVYRRNDHACADSDGENEGLLTDDTTNKNKQDHHQMHLCEIKHNVINVCNTSDSEEDEHTTFKRHHLGGTRLCRSASLESLRLPTNCRHSSVGYINFGGGIENDKGDSSDLLQVHRSTKDRPKSTPNPAVTSLSTKVSPLLSQRELRVRFHLRDKKYSDLNLEVSDV